jgi:hypothetical protein
LEIDEPAAPSGIWSGESAEAVMVDWGDPETFWLNATNAVLGIVTVVAFLMVAGAVLNEVLIRVRKRIASSIEDPHTFHAPLLGATMADGGERIERPGKPEGGSGPGTGKDRGRHPAGKGR